jgi:serine phosphatase RsbU (regulator of sigma subunit)
MMGVFPDAVYMASRVTLGSGERLLFYTDGIAEARSPDGEEFGDDRLAAAARAVRAPSAETLKDHVVETVSAFTGGRFDDDATLIAGEIS